MLKKGCVFLGFPLVAASLLLIQIPFYYVVYVRPLKSEGQLFYLCIKNKSTGIPDIVCKAFMNAQKERAGCVMADASPPFYVQTSKQKDGETNRQSLALRDAKFFVNQVQYICFFSFAQLCVKLNACSYLID